MFPLANMPEVPNKIRPVPHTKIAVIIPCYRVRGFIVDVVRNALEVADYAVVVDDACPEHSADRLVESVSDPRLQVLRHETNQGVGSAVITGFSAALKTDAEIFVKMDGDGQMDHKWLPRLVEPLLLGHADFTKANRFYDLTALEAMPFVRRLGNFGLTFLAKAASGFWHISDPTNGYLAIRRGALEILNLNALHKRYFFEIGLLVQLNIIRAVARDVPIPAKYDNETSSLNPVKILFSFPPKLALGLARRIWWRYFVYDINMVTLFLVTGTLLLLGGAGFGAAKWAENFATGGSHPAGTIAVALLPVVLGFQLLLQALVLDVIDKPDEPLSNLMVRRLPAPPADESAPSTAG